MNEPSLSPRQILSLESKGDRLYGEVVQEIARRDLYWFRPLFLIEDVYNKAGNLLDCNFVDLRQSSDLILPQNLFVSCFDAEIVPLLGKLYSRNSLPAEALSRRYLNDFVRSFWQKNREVFEQT